ncbi:MAG: hypothetical protein U0M42_09725 [Acutalibacteraceae bacterium]|nr:hypothetical protein [Acutalibacteraceae bacterium]
MSGTKMKIFVVSVTSVALILSVFIGAFVISQMNKSGFNEEFLQTQYSKEEEVASSSLVGSVEPEQSEIVSEESSEEHITVETGSYYNGMNRILIKSCDHGFIEGSIICDGITMEFSGQTVGNTLTATGIDSLNNTVEITLVFESNIINASSNPLIRYEVAANYIELDGEFKK